MLERRCAVVGDDDALARGEAVVLHDVGRAELVERHLDLVEGVAHVRASRWGRRGRHDVLRERLAALEPRRLRRSGRRWRCPAARSASATPRTSGRLGPDDDQVDAELRSEGCRGGWVGEVERVHPASAAIPALPGAACSSLDLGVRRESADESVLTGTRTEHEDLHGAEPSQGARRS